MTAEGRSPVASQRNYTVRQSGRFLHMPEAYLATQKRYSLPEKGRSVRQEALRVETVVDGVEHDTGGDGQIERRRPAVHG